MKTKQLIVGFILTCYVYGFIRSGLVMGVING